MKSKKASTYFFLPILLGFLLSGVLPMFSQGKTTVLFSSDEVLEMILTMPTRDVLRDIGDEREEHPATVSYLSSSGEMVQIPVDVRTRGHFRRDPVNCDFPPLRLDFDKDSLSGTLFEGQNKIKLVTHCRSRGKKYNQGVLKEYLAYRLYNLFTDESYKVRLVNVIYTDSEGRKDSLSRTGFFIEPTELLAERTGGEVFELANVSQDHCDLEKCNVMAVFQYMIGNTDWSVPGRHNIDMLKYSDMSPPVTVPYDFDWCGLVNAPYAKPNEILGLDDVKTRLFRGTCRTDVEFQKTFDLFIQKKDEVYQTISSVPGMEDKEIDKTRKYMDQFYKIIENPRMAKNEFHNKCLTR
jgi:hypothetical protein